MVEAMGKLEAGDLPLTPQAEDGVLYAAKISKEETHIDFAKPARDVHNHIRGLSPFPGAWFEAEIGGKVERIKVLASVVAEGEGAAGTVIGEDGTIACGGARAARAAAEGGRQAAGGKEFLRGTPLPSG